MNVGEKVKYEKRPDWGIGKVVQIQATRGTYLVKWNHGYQYHLPWMLERLSDQKECNRDEG